MVGSRRGQVVRAVTELAVIVAGVLIALTADAWYERRSDLELESALILDLLAEFRTNEARLRDDIQINELAYEAAEAMLPLLTRPPANLPIDSVGSLQQLGTARYDPDTGVLRGIIGSGQLALLSDGVLRSELAGWLDQVEAHKLHSQAISMRATPGRVAEIWAAPVTPRTNLAVELLWSAILLERRQQLEGMNDLLGSTVALIQLLEEAAAS